MLSESKADPGRYELVSPYYPSQAAVPDAPGAHDNAWDSVIAEMCGAIASKQAPWESRCQAMFNLMNVNDEAVTRALEVAVNDSDSRVNIFAAAFLLQRNDMAGLVRADAA